MADHDVRHIEIPAPDLEQACKFYEAVFGWTIDNSVTDYPMFMDGSKQSGGGFVQGAQPSTTAGIVPFINVDDIDAILGAVEGNGGSTVTARTAAGEMGEYAVFADPAGNHMGLWQSAEGQATAG